MSAQVEETQIQGSGDLSILKYLAVPALAADSKGKILVWNGPAEQLTGLAAKDVLGKPCWSAFSSKKMRTPVEEALSSGEAEHREQFAFVRKDERTTCVVDFSASPVMGTDNDVTMVVATLVPSAVNDKALESISKTVDELMAGTIAGNSSLRADVSKYEGASAKIVTNMNQLLDAVTGPLNVAADYVDKLSKGIIPDKITAVYNGDFNTLKTNLNQCIDTLTGLTGEMARMSQEHENGDIDFVMDISKFAGIYRTVARGINDMVGAHIAVKRRSMAIFAEFGHGNFEASMELLPGKKRFINEIIEQVRGNLKALISDTHTLVQATLDGRLGTRADTTKHQGDFRKIIQGINDTLDAVIHPLNVAADYIEKLSKGIIPDKIAAKYDGDFNTLKTNLNQCIDTLTGLTSEMTRMSQEHEKGDIDVVMDISKFAGVYRTVAHGINDMVGAHIAVKRRSMAIFAEFGQGNFEASMEPLPGKKRFINEIIEQVRGNLKALITDTHMLVQAALDGRLGTRADTAKHQGDFRKIIQGINEMLDAIIMPMNEAASVLDRVAVRDLRSRVNGDYKGDHAKIKNAVNASVDALHEALVQVADAADQVAGASNQIAASSQAVAEGASEQASSLEETSRSLEQISSMTNRNAENTSHAKGLATTARTAADSGAKSMGQMLDAMGQIRTAAKNTAEIIRDINEIAFQTNLLALNAAVEAARAGDAGRGFAVVAEEVRNLAQRAKEAAKKTETLINQSVQLSEGGEKICQQVGTNLNEIVGAVAKVTDIVGEIAASSIEQSRGITAVNGAVTQMEQVTQSSAASAEESSSAAEELASQSEELAAMAGGFELHRTIRRLQPTAPSLQTASRANPTTTSTSSLRKVPAKPQATPARKNRNQTLMGPNVAQHNSHGVRRFLKNDGNARTPESILPLADDSELEDF